MGFFVVVCIKNLPLTVRLNRVIVIANCATALWSIVISVQSCASFAVVDISSGTSVALVAAWLASAINVHILIVARALI